MLLSRSLLRALALAWCVVQVLGLGAVWPRDCCAWHEVPAHEVASTPNAGEHCPMHADGAGTPSAEPQDEATCYMRGTCGGPSVYAIFTSPGVLPDSSVPTPRFLTAHVDAPVAEHHGALSAPPDAPPPRA